MAEKLTPQQLQAVTDRGGRLLVSAAAGSGKTKVLVDRLLGYLTDPIHPKDIDSFLIITFTKAAAAELRGKIATALSKRVAEDPQNVGLQRQLQRLYMTQISTVHSFCADLLRQYAYRLDLQGDFRVAEENEIAQIRQSVMEQVLDHAYENGAQDEYFRAFVDTQGLSRSDNQLIDLLLGVYDSAMCHLAPEQWLDGCVDAVLVKDAIDAAQTDWGRALMEDFWSKMDEYGNIMAKCAAMAQSIPGENKAAALLLDNAEALRKCRNLTTWDAIVDGAGFSFGTLRFTSKCPDAAMAEQIKALRNACKDAVADAFAPFQDHSAQVLDDLNRSASAVRGMVTLVKQFSKAFALEKKRRGILDFSDLEHKTLDLLVGKDRSAPTALAHEIGNRYCEVMVDEYQDSNAVQDRIYMALTHQRHNCFMVGDVKQSIYQFRLADPDIFIKKYNDYADAEQAKPMEGRRVVLSKNFRSGPEVLDAVNCVFRTCMSPKVGGLHYGDTEALYEGLDHTPLGECAIELQAISVVEETYPEEARAVAERIRQLLDGTHFVRDKENGLRPIVPEDIVILLRSPKSVSSYYVRALEQIGIPCTSGLGDDLLQSREVSLLRAMLQVVLNPRLDIPLANVLMSPLFSFSADELAIIRAQNRAGSLYEAVQNSSSEKATAFCDMLRKLRQEMKLSSLGELMEKILEYTHLDSIFAAMDDGDLRMEHLNTFYLYAVNWSNAGQGSVQRFLEHLDALEEKNAGITVANQNMGAVTIMSIHKSKGLEFPVVFLAGLSRSFNMDSAQNQVLCHKDLGIGINAADPTRRLRYPTIAKRVLSARIEADGLSEEMRVLYVAMTRAKDRLIMTYASKHLQKRLQRLVLMENSGCRNLAVEQAGCPGDWVLLAALQQTQAAALFALGGQCASSHVAAMPWAVSVNIAPDLVQTENTTVQEQSAPVHIEQLCRGILFQYPYEPWARVPSKLTATELKNPNAPASVFTHKHWDEGASRSTGGKEMGTAVHALMQYLDLSRCQSIEAIGQQALELVQQGLICADMYADMDVDMVYQFFCTPLGKKMQSHGNVLREFQFSLLVDASIYADGLEGEQILLQGVVDCALVDDDGITIIDFKTDRVSGGRLEQAVEKYRPQVLAYASAMERIYERKIKSAVLYFFDNGQTVDIL